MPTNPNRYLLMTRLLIFLIPVLFFFTSCQVGTEESETAASTSNIEVDNPIVILATTTSTYDSGLLDVLVPIFEDQSGYSVKVIAVGTGHALKMGTRGDADVLLVHAPAAEKVLIDDGDAVDRQLVMHNDFVLVGPAADPARVSNSLLVSESFQNIAQSRSVFVSRGDDSGTHKRELTIWEEAGHSPDGEWYLEAGQGMGATLRIASEKGAYTLTDRATYLALEETLDLKIFFEGDNILINPYHVMLVNPENWPAINQAGAQAWRDFLLSSQGQDLIGQFRADEFGMPLFIPDAGKNEEQLGGG